MIVTSFVNITIIKTTTSVEGNTNDNDMIEYKQLFKKYSIVLIA